MEKIINFFNTLYHEYLWVILVAVVILLIPSVSVVFDMQTCNVLTVALSFIPALVFALVYELIPLFKKRK